MRSDCKAAARQSQSGCEAIAKEVRGDRSGFASDRKPTAKAYCEAIIKRLYSGFEAIAKAIAKQYIRDRKMISKRSDRTEKGSFLFYR
jgi:hypothetical protein